MRIKRRRMRRKRRSRRKGVNIKNELRVNGEK